MMYISIKCQQAQLLYNAIYSKHDVILKNSISMKSLVKCTLRDYYKNCWYCMEPFLLKLNKNAKIEESLYFGKQKKS